MSPTETVPHAGSPDEAKELETPDWRAPCRYSQAAFGPPSGCHQFDKTVRANGGAALFCTRCGATRDLDS